MIEIWDRNGLLTVAEPVWFFACMFKRHPSIIRHWDDLEEVAILQGVGKDLADGGSRTNSQRSSADRPGTIDFKCPGYCQHGDQQIKCPIEVPFARLLRDPPIPELTFNYTMYTIWLVL
ncbi:hypothetical protein Y032_0086g1938 [Ancylostoma ceylanicum]|uniref:Uncharacterized protein n=1 Tax=Ancylostoma ceylanicum TaxID=53326 RepID=A0A016TPY3_9BILA|nr:hypothetical protein Y032_0086g1938 [Ancylostoma ceylanicum]